MAGAFCGDCYLFLPMDSLIRYYIEAWQRGFDYAGRSSRPAYWWFYLANLIVGFLLALLVNVSDFFFKILVIYVVASVLPNLAITIRRLRDSGKPWPWIFISFVPFIGGVWLIILLCQPSVGPIA
ncbi:MAG: DUF805 domain-containing protein [Cyanobacteriota bacterium]|nr:DUF805 domain-containing protein [Cyanobacteriota bacterium]